MSKEFKEVKFLTTNEVEGKVEAVFSVFNEVDSDGDVVQPKSMRRGYGDKGVAMVWAHDWKDVVGRGVIEQDDEKAVFKGQFNMTTERGKEAFNTVKEMGDLQQWSFGYEVLDSEKGLFTKDGFEQEVRYLKDVKVWEVSPVLVGANQNTYTLATKQVGSKGEDDEIRMSETSNTTNEKGTRFQDDIEDLLIKLVSLNKRAKELTSLRLSKNKMLSETSVEALTTLQDSIQELHADIDTILHVGTEEVEEVDTETDDIYAETSRILAETVDIDIEGEEI